MMRRLLFVFALMMIPAAVLAAPTVYDQVWGDRVDERLCDLEAEVGIEAPECVPATTTTTTVDTTTTTVPETTTTTSPTTTTTAPTTTTTTVPGLVIPPTLPPDYGLKAGGGYTFMLGCVDWVDRVGTVLLDCPETSSGGLEYVSLDYFGHGMPYLYSWAVPGMMNHAWWVEGDRQGYQCGYGFMLDEHPNPFGMFAEDRPSEIIARFTAVRPFDSGYGKVNDRYMAEGIRFYDGTLTGQTGGEISEENCRSVALDDFDYASYEPHGPDQIRVGLFHSTGEIADIRDLTLPEIADDLGHWEFVSLVDGRATIVFVLHQNQSVMLVVYYDALGSGLIAVEVNGTTTGG